MILALFLTFIFGLFIGWCCGLSVDRDDKELHKWTDDPYYPYGNLMEEELIEATKERHE